MSEWKEVRISEICTYITDCVNKTAPVVSYTTPYRMIRTSNVKNGKVDLADVKHVTEEVYKQWTRRGELQKDDIILTREAPVGEVGIIVDGANLFLGQRLMMYRVNPEKASPHFVYYSFLHRDMQHQFSSAGMGSTIHHIRVPDCSRFKVRLPPLPEQRTIAGILSALDDKIDLLRQQNQTLEQLAQLLFHRWFVAFEFPDANGQPYRSNGGAMQPTKLGEVPEGWHVGSFLEVAKLLSGGTPKTDTPEYWNGDIPWISAKDVSATDSCFILATEKMISESGIRNSAAKMLPALTTVISARGTVGEICLLASPMAISQSNYGLKAQLQGTDLFVFLYTSLLVEKLKAQAYGTVFDTITTATFKDFELVIPHSDVQVDFENTVKPLFDKLLTNLHQIQTLTNLRDTLLPKLISGQLPVSATEPLLA